MQCKTCEGHWVFDVPPHAVQPGRLCMSIPKSTLVLHKPIGLYAYILFAICKYMYVIFYKKLKNVSCEYDRVNDWNSTLQAAWYIRHVRIIWFLWTKRTVWLLILSFTQNDTLKNAKPIKQKPKTISSPVGLLALLIAVWPIGGSESSYLICAFVFSFKTLRLD